MVCLPPRMGEKMLFRSYFAKPLLTLSLIASLGGAFASSPAFAAEPSATGGDDYDFSWLDPEKKIYVVQNRKYLKQNRFELAVSGGLGMGEAYRTRRILLPRAIFYASEQFGISVFGGFNKNSENGNSIDLRSISNKIPAIRDVNSFVGASVMWMPFYGKLNMFNQILYLDWHIEAGVSSMSTEIDLNTNVVGDPRIETGNYVGFHWGTGQKFFITRHWAARLDFMAQYYKAPIGIIPGQPNATVTNSNETPSGNYDNYYVTLGVSYTF
jgi:outer membrane beta-barrel protein